MELSKQEMELFLLFHDFELKNCFNKILTIFTKESKSSFTNRKCNDPNRKWNYFSYIQTLDQKTFLTKNLPFLQKNPNPFLQSGNRIIKTGNGIISPNS